MDETALQLTSRFSLPPNSLGYCGRDSAPAKLIDCVLTGHCNGIEDELSKFIVLNPYLETLAEITGLEKFSYPVVSGYWLGNDQLQKATIRHYWVLLKNFAKQGVPDWLIKDLRQKPPLLFIPFHLFQVLHVGVGRASGSVPYNLNTINDCMIRWGRIERISSGNLTVSLNSLGKVGSMYNLIIRKQELVYRSDLLPKLKTGDIVAVHWNQVVRILNPNEEENLRYWTMKTLATMPG